MRKLLPLITACIMLTSCGGCGNRKCYEIWDEYRNQARAQTDGAKKGNYSKDQLPARYYLWLMWRDMRLEECGCPKESPSQQDRYQVFYENIDPICVLVLTNRYVELSKDSIPKDSIASDSTVIFDEKKNITDILTWYGQAIGLGDVQSYDAYGGLIPMDTEMINKKVRELSLRFNAAHAHPIKVELIDECEKLSRVSP